MFLFPMVFLPSNCSRPPLLRDIMDSMVNWDVEERTKYKDLATATHEQIFDFNYPLSSHINKNDFEEMILEKFILRRIAYDTFTSWQIQLKVRLKEIMPMYNKMFDMLDGWDLFNDGESETRNVIDGRSTTNSQNIINNQTNTNTQSLTNVINGTTISDRRYSDTPQGQLVNVQNGTYLSEYNYDTNTDNQTTNNITSNNGSINNSSSASGNIREDGSLSEQITRTPADKIKIYKEFIENKTAIMTMIFNDLESLFLAVYD